MPLSRVLPVVLAAVLAAAPVPAAGERPPVLVLQHGPGGSRIPGHVLLLDPGTLAIRATLDTGIGPASALLDPDGRRLWVLSAGKIGFSTTFTLKGGVLQVFDLSTGAELCAYPLDPGPHGPFLTGSSSSVIVTCDGEKHGNATALVVDRTTLEATKRSLGAGLWVAAMNERQHVVVSPSGRTIFVLRAPAATETPASGPRFFKGAASAPSRLVALDAATGAVILEREMPPRCAQIMPSEDGTMFYVLCGGHVQPKTAAKEGLLGSAHVLESETGEELAATMLGFDPPPLVPLPDGRVLAFPHGGKQLPPRVIVLEAGRVTASLDLPGDALRVDPIPGTTDLAVLCVRHLVRADAALSRIVWQRELPFDAGDLAVQRDGRTAWAAEARGSAFGAVRLGDDGPIEVLHSGRGGVKFGKGVASAVTIIAVIAPFIALAALAPAAMVAPPPNLPVYVPRAARPSLALSADGAYLFVFNRQTEDVTVVDTAAGAILDRRGVGSANDGLAISLPSGQRALLVGKGTNALIEVGSGGAVAVQRFEAQGELTKVLAAPRRGEWWIVRSRGIEIFDAATGAARASVAIEDPTEVLFLEAP